LITHQYVDRATHQVCNEPLFHDRIVGLLYGPMREYAPALFRAATSARATRLLAWLNYDSPLVAGVTGGWRFLRSWPIDWSECLDDPRTFQTLREAFERKIRYWECRPMPAAPHAVVSPADARVLVGSLAEHSHLRIKDKLFEFSELLGPARRRWLDTFAGGDFAVFRLTPEKYHYNHAPVTGVVVDHYEIDGAFHACNPTVVVEVATPYSKNRRVVTIIDTDVPGGTGVGKVAMIEVVALMIGQVVQCYSEFRYHDPQPIAPGLMISRGQPKSLYRPGSSTDVLLFEPNRIKFAADLVANRFATATSRYSLGPGLVETDVAVRSLIGSARSALTIGNNGNNHGVTQNTEPAPGSTTREVDGI
jgi:phosphatidylserine decarboxylase